MKSLNIVVGVYFGIFAKLGVYTLKPFSPCLAYIRMSKVVSVPDYTSLLTFASVVEDIATKSSIFLGSNSAAEHSYCRILPSAATNTCEPVMQNALIVLVSGKVTLSYDGELPSYANRYA